MVFLDFSVILVYVGSGYAGGTAEPGQSERTTVFPTHDNGGVDPNTVPWLGVWFEISQYHLTPLPATGQNQVPR